VLDDPVRAGQLLAFGLGPADEDLRPCRRRAEPRDRQRTANLQRVRRLDALLPALERHRARALVALSEAALQERDRQLVLPLRGLELDLAQPVVDLLDG